MHPKNSHWRNRFRCVFQLSPIVLTSSIATNSALANSPNSLPVPQPEPPTPPKPLIRLPQTPEPSPLPTPTPPEALPSPAFSLNSATSDALSATTIKSTPSPMSNPPAPGLPQDERQPTPFPSPIPTTALQESPSLQNTPSSALCSETTSAQESGATPDSITVEEFEFVVNHPVFTPAELKSFTNSYLNKALSKAQLLSVAAEITKQYAARGYSTSSAVVYIPKTQQPGKRTAIIRVIEGELERIDVKSLPANKEDTEGSLVRLNPNYVRSAKG